MKLFSRITLAFAMLLVSLYVPSAEARSHRTISIIPEEVLKLEMEMRWAEAEIAYRSLLAQKPVPQGLWLRYVDVLAVQGKTEEAAIALIRATRANPDDHELAARASSFNAQAGRAQAAMRLMETAMAAAPDRLDYMDRHARLASWAEDYDAARESLGRMVARQSGDADLHLRYGRVLAWLGRTDGAKKQIGRALRLKPDMHDARLEYARLQSWQGNYKGALANLEEYRQGGGDEAKYAGEKALNLAWANRPGASLATSEPALEASPEDRSLLYSQAVALERAHRHDEANARLQQIEAMSPDEPDTLLLRRLLTVPDAPNVSAGVTASADGDDIDILSMRALATYALKDDNRISIGGEYTYVSAPAGSGLDRIDGGENIEVKRVWAEARVDVTEKTAVTAKLGLGDTDFGSTRAIYGIEVSHKASDTLELGLSHNRDYHAVSPRALSLDVMRSETGGSISFKPDFNWQFDLSARYSDFSDGNSALRGDATIRRAILRSATLNADIGLSGSWYGYDRDLDNGYYDPKSYQRYLVPFYLYMKLKDGDGISLVFAPGIQKDEEMSGFSFSGNTYAEGTFGLYNKWMLKARVGLTVGASDYTDNYWVASGGLHLTRRF